MPLIRTFFVIILPLFATVGVAEDFGPAPWYLGGHLGAAAVEDESGAADRGVFVRAALGRQLDQAITLELEGAGGTVELDPGSDLDQAYLALNVVLVNRRPIWNPYFLVGVGSFHHDAPSLSDTGPMGQVGIGGMWDLNGYGLMLRADLRYRWSGLDHEIIEDGQTELSIGLDFPFGR